MEETFKKLAEAHKKTSLRLTTTNAKSSDSKFGGNPHVPRDFQWPVGAHGKPLNFLCQISLNEIALFEAANQLPKTGMLSFFYDCEDMPWGISPEDFTGWRVYHFADTSQLAQESAPPGTASELTPQEAYITFREEITYPDLNSEEASNWDLPDDDSDEYSDFVEDSYGEQPFHRLMGHAQLVQNDLLADCTISSRETVSDNGNSDVTHKPAPDWQLLLQIDTDDDLGVMWGDAGMIYYCIRQSDLKAGAFDKVWLILQCY